MKMIKLHTTWALLLLLTACNTPTRESGNMPTTRDSIPQQSTSIVGESWQRSDTVTCDFTYDTITDEHYTMHLLILEKFEHPEKRGYAFSPEGDTVNFFLYHQDIAAFLLRLDPTEQGIYWLLTNKVVFRILEYEPRMLDYGLTGWMRNKEQLAYFLEHVANPTCNTLPIDSTAHIIQRDMEEPNERAQYVKRMLLDQLEQAAR